MYILAFPPALPVFLRLGQMQINVNEPNFALQDRLFNTFYIVNKGTAKS